MTLVGSDRSIVTQECEKLILYCFGQSIISTNDVVEICGDTASFGSDQLIDQMLAGDMNAVDRMLSSLDSGSGGMRAILPMILLHLSRLIEITEAMARGLGVEMAVKNARPPIFFKRQSAISAQLRKFKIEDLLNMQQSISATLFETRKQADLSDALTSRSLLSMARLARSKSNG